MINFDDIEDILLVSSYSKQKTKPRKIYKVISYGYFILFVCTFDFNFLWVSLMFYCLDLLF